MKKPNKIILSDLEIKAAHQQTINMVALNNLINNENKKPTKDDYRKALVRMVSEYDVYPHVLESKVKEEFESLLLMQQAKLNKLIISTFKKSTNLLHTLFSKSPNVYLIRILVKQVSKYLRTILQNDFYYLHRLKSEFNEQKKVKTKINSLLMSYDF